MVEALPPRVFGDGFEHELLQLFRDHDSGVAGVVAIHSTALGAAMGGVRVRTYANIEAGVKDALRLSRAMTLKNSAAGLDLGGGKAVLFDDGVWDRRADRLRFFGDLLEQLEGRYVTAEDAGTSAADMDVIAERTRWVVGRSLERGGRGDPSVATARTVFAAIERAALLHLGVDSLEGVKVGVLGAGKVGGALVEMLSAAGACVPVADLDPARATALALHPAVDPVPVDGFLVRELDVLAPCGFGEVIGVDDVPRMRCRVVAGAANNPLVDRATAVALAERDILYVPDFIANCGGILHVAAELLRLDAAQVDRRVEASAESVEAILRSARELGELPLDIAERQALDRVREARQ
jgi:glutamate dehydrogenase/leucine dehydrogenase